MSTLGDFFGCCIIWVNIKVIKKFNLEQNCASDGWIDFYKLGVRGDIETVKLVRIGGNQSRESWKLLNKEHIAKIVILRTPFLVLMIFFCVLKLIEMWVLVNQ